MTVKPFADTVTRELQNPEFALAYLQDALDDSPQEFVIALRKYVHANGGVARVAPVAHLSPGELTDLLESADNPPFRPLHALLAATGLHLRLEIIK